jgi:hypothetical protein
MVERRQIMDETTKIEFDYIKKSINDIKLIIEKFTEKEDKKLTEILELNRKFDKFEVECDTCRNLQLRERLEIKAQIRAMQEKPTNNMKGALLWISLIVGISSVAGIAWLVIKFITKLDKVISLIK